MVAAQVALEVTLPTLQLGRFWLPYVAIRYSDTFIHLVDFAHHHVSFLDVQLQIVYRFVSASPPYFCYQIDAQDNLPATIHQMAPLCAEDWLHFRKSDCVMKAP